MKQFSSIVKHDSTSDADEAQQWIGKRSSYPIPSVPEPKSSITRATDLYHRLIPDSPRSSPFHPTAHHPPRSLVEFAIAGQEGGVRHIVLLGPDAGE